MSDTLERWENNMIWANEGCECEQCDLCHTQHREESYFSVDCEFCKEEKCSGCHGNGQIWTGGIDYDCGACKGSGRI